MKSVFRKSFSWEKSSKKKEEEKEEEQYYSTIEGSLIEENKILVEHITGKNQPLPDEIQKLICKYLVLLWDEAGVIGFAHPKYKDQNPKPIKDKFGIPKHPPTPKDWRGNFKGDSLPKYSQYLYGGHMTRVEDKLRTVLVQNGDKVTQKMLEGRLEFGFSKELGVGTTAVYDITPEDFRFLHSKITTDTEKSRFCINYRARISYGSEQLGNILFSLKFIPRDMATEHLIDIPVYKVEVCYDGFTQKNELFNEYVTVPELPNKYKGVEFEYYGYEKVYDEFKNNAFVKVDRPTVGVVRVFIKREDEDPICQMLNFTKFIKESKIHQKYIKVQFEMAFSGIYENVASCFSLGKQVELKKTTRLKL